MFEWEKKIVEQIKYAWERRDTYKLDEENIRRISNAFNLCEADIERIVKDK